ncbi:hypothetical protein HZH66_008379 [Vespula vulgaris]|uniref:Uncharacterized protein n=1 Tax=Vespula vulgaris TaxID=7454 RepID=A0A834JS27_VESVU|nr:hypothetical protein HZH66_008379 [Vespula vulgaris]
MVEQHRGWVLLPSVALASSLMQVQRSASAKDKTKKTSPSNTTKILDARTFLEDENEESPSIAKNVVAAREAKSSFSLKTNRAKILIDINGSCAERSHRFNKIWKDGSVYCRIIVGCDNVRWENPHVCQTLCEHRHEISHTLRVAFGKCPDCELTYGARLTKPVAGSATLLAVPPITSRYYERRT